MLALERLVAQLTGRVLRLVFIEAGQGLPSFLLYGLKIGDIAFCCVCDLRHTSTLSSIAGQEYKALVRIRIRPPHSVVNQSR